MDIYDIIMLISVGYIILHAILIAQSFTLYYVNKAPSWLVIALGFGVFGIIQLWRTARIPAYVLRERARGGFPESLTIEQWITLGLPAIPLTIFIIGMHMRRKEFRDIGI